MIWLAKNQTDALRITAQFSGFERRPSLGESIKAYFWLFFFGLICPSSFVLVLIADKSALWHDWMSLSLAVLALVSVFLGVRFYSVLKAEISFSDSEVVSRAPLGFGSWTIRTSDIHTICLISTHGQKLLEFGSLTGPEGRVELYDELSKRLRAMNGR